jgi:hypothetical protein
MDGSTRWSREAGTIRFLTCHRLIGQVRDTDGQRPEREADAWRPLFRF